MERFQRCGCRTQFIFKVSFQPSELQSVRADYRCHNHPFLLMVIYNLQCIFTYFPGDPHNSLWCDFIETQEVKLLQDCFSYM